jgi:acyl-CoA thioester hydrolase
MIATNPLIVKRAPSDLPHVEHFTVRWSDLDFNGHLRNTAFSEFASHTRFDMLVREGFTPAKFDDLRLGPILFQEQVRYRREIHFGERVRVSALFTGLAVDGSRWRVTHEITGGDGRHAAELSVDGAWIDLDRRSLAAPPPELLRILEGFPRIRDFEVLASVVSRRKAAAAG